jgi:hypothetical protein
MITWGQLAKSQIDSEKIEEAIARLIAEHNADPEAHLVEGGSLKSHKMAEIIDHLVNSIVEDKIGNREVGILKVKVDKYYIRPTFETIDVFNVVYEGIGSNVYPWINSIQVRSGTAAGNKTYLFHEHPLFAVDSGKEPHFEVGADFSADSDVIDVAFGIGFDNPFSTTMAQVGFIWKSSVRKLYAKYKGTGNYTESEITGFNPNIKNIFRVELSSDGETAYFYVNDVLKKTLTNIHVYLDSNDFFGVGVRNSSGQGEAWFFNLIFFQNI